MRRLGALALALSATLAVAPAALAEGAWIADLTKGCKVFNPHPTAQEAVRWSGGCQGGVAAGPGTLQWLRGPEVIETDVGTWVAGHQMGHARQEWPGGSYEGDVSDGLPHGRGLLVVVGSRYEGEFRDGKADGHGVLTSGALTYIGVWHQGCLSDGKQKAAIGVPVTSCK